MAFDAFLKIDGIPGESTDDKHKDWIEVLSYGVGIQQPPPPQPAAPVGQLLNARISRTSLSLRRSTKRPLNWPSPALTECT